jgi:hypothetical protein
MGCLIGLHLLRPMIDRSRRGRKKTVKKKKGIESGRREKKLREIAFAGRKRNGATLHFQPAWLIAVSGHR